MSEHLSSLEVFISVHDQDIVIDCERGKKYAQAPNYKYVFLGNGDTSAVEHLGNIIIARDLPHNIEQYRYLVDYTGWYSLIKNDLIERRHVSLIHYDSDISVDFARSTLSALELNPNQFLGYVPWSMIDENFLENNIGAEPLEKVMRQVYDIDIREIVREHIQRTSDVVWPSSNNVATSVETLRGFVNWFEPCIEPIASYKGCGHAFERAIKIFCILNHLTSDYLPEVLQHQQLDSHRTQHNSPEHFEKKRLEGPNLKKRTGKGLPFMTLVRKALRRP